MEAPVSHHAPVAVGSTYSRFADAVSVGGVAERAVGQVERHGAQRMTVTWFAGVGGSVRSLGVSEETGLAVLTLVSFSVVQTVTHASAALARLPPRRPIKTAALSVSVTLTLPTFLRSPRQSVSRLPGSVVIERSAVLAVITCSVVSAHTLPMDLREREIKKINKKERERAH